MFKYIIINSGIKSNVQRYEMMLEQNTIRKSELNQKILKSKSEESLFEEAICACQAKLVTISDEIRRNTDENQGIEQKIQELQQGIERANKEYNELQTSYLGEKSRYESLLNLTERYEGYGISIKKVMEQKKHMPGIIGVVADIIKVDKSYEIAIETALGGAIQNIVTQEEQTAKDLITYLKQNKYGRATFLPLTNISSSLAKNNEGVLKEKGVIGIASHLVESEKRFEGLMDYLLGKIIVVDHIEHAVMIAKKYHYSLRLVTLEGELITPGGSISGGAYKNASNLLGRRRELEAMEEQIAGCLKRLQDCEQKKEEYKTLRNALREKQEEIKIILQKKFLEQNTAKHNLELESAKKNEAERIYQEYHKELKEIELQAQELRENLKELQTSLATNADQNKQNELRIEALTKLLEEERIQEQNAMEEVSRQRLSLSSLEQNNQFLMENVRRIKRELEKLFEEEAKLNTDIARTSESILEKKQLISQTETIVNAYKIALRDLELKIAENTKEKEQITSVYKRFFVKREELSGRIGELDKECFRLNSQKEKLLEQTDQQMSYMWEEYELTYTLAREYPVELDISLAQVKKSITDLKLKIKELGDVNVNAIEDFKNLSERYEFLSTQKEDLIHAEEALLQIIHELDEEMRIQFSEKFKAINEQFDLVFKELFGGGKADLELTQSEDILEAGIRINGQPPGKKLQNMMQLSGGEKALTAISLLFAIQNLKPSPFCLLDEIEAALDDSNVSRFAKYLHKLTKDTQFIIITHRRGTMAAADILYGITMQEKGVSTLVSVNLIENELDQ